MSFIKFLILPVIFVLIVIVFFVIIMKSKNKKEEQKTIETQAASRWVSHSAQPTYPPTAVILAQQQYYMHDLERGQQHQAAPYVEQQQPVPYMK